RCIQVTPPTSPSAAIWQRAGFPLVSPSATRAKRVRGGSMKATVLCLPWLLLAASAAHAQQPSSASGCPQLPAGAGLEWEHRATADSDFCRALREDGSEAFGLYIADSSPVEPRRKNREETGQVGGFEVQWYRAEIATRPDIAARETLIELPDGRV